ncbi:hypothetical protein FFZ96_15740 [Leptospira borgpetersenii]|nr:hypothetical protein LBHB_05735 [Leptospira borgpetersenii serovar Hardjo]TQE52937.1 hypothetical protein FFZ96_15740 [Leptospira borgpetersenii]
MDSAVSAGICGNYHANFVYVPICGNSYGSWTHCSLACGNYHDFARNWTTSELWDLPQKEKTSWFSREIDKKGEECLDSKPNSEPRKKTNASDRQRRRTVAIPKRVRV